MLFILIFVEAVLNAVNFAVLNAGVYYRLYDFIGITK
jgi:hypothetical protein